MKKKLFLEVIVYLVIVLFVYASSFKLLAHRNFISQIDKSPLFDESMSAFLSWVIPLSEIAAVILLFTSRYRKIGLYFSFLLMSVFTGYIAFNILFVEYRACACGGILDKMGFEEHLVFNLVFVLLIAVAIRLESTLRSSEQPLSQNVF